MHKSKETETSINREEIKKNEKKIKRRKKMYALIELRRSAREV